MTLYLHDTSRRLLEQLVTSLPQSVLLSGPEGIGLASAVCYIGEQIGVTPLMTLPEKDEVVDIEKGSITIDIIRRLHTQVRGKTITARLIVIDYAERMTHQAQNGFLKLLEEPSPYTHFVLLTHRPDTLLPTIRSRVQHVDLRPITPEQSTVLLDELGVHDTTRRQQLLYIASGLPAELTRLARDEAQFEARAAILRDARTLLRGSAYDRLLVAHAYKDNRPRALVLVGDALTMLASSLSGASTTDTAIIERLDALEHIHRRITGNGNIRLALAASVI